MHVPFEVTSTIPFLMGLAFGIVATRSAYMLDTFLSQQEIHTVTRHIVFWSMLFAGISVSAAIYQFCQ